MKMIEIISLILALSSVIMISYVSISNYHATKKVARKV
ncbi:MAG: hypothetical protein JWR18_3113 [Segetibacter sp.]|jgi:Flp pilus assembly protein CpaB|nr:hypothetical protein [Segetibacter sp.]